MEPWKIADRAALTTFYPKSDMRHCGRLPRRVRRKTGVRYGVPVSASTAIAVAASVMK